MSLLFMLYSLSSLFGYLNKLNLWEAILNLLFPTHYLSLKAFDLTFKYQCLSCRANFTHNVGKKRRSF